MIGAWLSLALAGPAQRYALVIGANVGLPTDEPLRFADRDAERVAHVLTDLGDVPPENVVTLRNVDASRVQQSLAALAERIERQGGASETLLFTYYSGHADAGALHLSGTTLAFGELLGGLQRMPVDVRVLVVDACQSGELTRLKGAAPAEPFTIVSDGGLDSEGIAVITSSSLGEDAQESDRLEGGVFTHHFVAGLMGAADRSADGRVTLNEAHGYARDATIRTTSAARFVQHPSFATELRGGADLVLTRVDDPGTAAGLLLSGDGTWWVFDTRGSVVAEALVEGAARLVVPRGDYLVRWRGGGVIREGAYSVGSGESLEVRSAALTAVAPGQTVRKGMDESRRSAVAIVAGFGAVGATAPQMPSGPSATAGLLVDTASATVAGRLQVAAHRQANEVLVLQQRRVGGELSTVRKGDFGALAAGVGVRGGIDAVFQRFETDGVAPPRRGVTGRVGPVLAVDLRLGPQLGASLVGGPDITVYRRDEGAGTELATQVTPTVHLEWARYLR